MSVQTNPTPFQRISILPYPVIISCVGLLALGGAAGHSMREATEPILGYVGSIFVSAVPCVAALFAVGLLIKFPWKTAIAGSILLVVGAFAFEELPKLLEPRLGSGFVCHLVAGIAAMIAAFVSYVVLSKLLTIRGTDDSRK